MQAAGDRDGLSGLVAKALYEGVRLRDEAGSDDEAGMRAILYAVFPNELKELVDADKANGWKLADWIEKNLLLQRWRERAKSSPKSPIDLLVIPMAPEPRGSGFPRH